MQTFHLFFGILNVFFKSINWSLWSLHGPCPGHWVSSWRKLKVMPWPLESFSLLQKVNHRACTVGAKAWGGCCQAAICWGPLGWGLRAKPYVAAAAAASSQRAVQWWPSLPLFIALDILVTLSSSYDWKKHFLQILQQVFQKMALALCHHKMFAHCELLCIDLLKAFYHPAHWFCPLLCPGKRLHESARGKTRSTKSNCFSLSACSSAAAQWRCCKTVHDDGNSGPPVHRKRICQGQWQGQWPWQTAWQMEERD